VATPIRFSLPLLERFLGGERAVDAERLERWRQVSPSAVRRAAAAGAVRE